MGRASSNDLERLFGIHIFGSLLVTISAHILDKRARAAMRQCFEMESTKKLLTAAHTLLMSCYGVVVEGAPPPMDVEGDEGDEADVGGWAGL